MTIDSVFLRVHLCADSLGAVTAFVDDLSSVFKSEKGDPYVLDSSHCARHLMFVEPSNRKENPQYFQSGLRLAQVLWVKLLITSQKPSFSIFQASVDELAFKKMPEVGPAPDMINDDLPTNLEYLDESFGAAAGLRELSDDDLEGFEIEETDLDKVTTSAAAGGSVPGIVSRVGGETIKMLRSEGVHIVDNFFDTLPLDTASETVACVNSVFESLRHTPHSPAYRLGKTTFRLHINSGDLTLLLYDGYDWAKTRKTIAEEVKEMRRRLAKIRQLVASGQTQEQSFERTGALLFNSLYIGLEQDADALEPGALIAAIDEELKDDIEIASQSSWQSLKPALSSAMPGRSPRVHGKRLTRSKGSSMEFRLSGIKSEVDHYDTHEPTASRTFITIRDVEILDHIKTSTWRKFLTELRSDSRGNIRETNSNMVRVELLSVRPVPGHLSEEARLRVSSRSQVCYVLTVFSRQKYYRFACMLIRMLSTF